MLVLLQLTFTKNISCFHVSTETLLFCKLHDPFDVVERACVGRSQPLTVGTLLVVGGRLAER